MAPRLSVVVPFHNVEGYLGDCLQSLARQTFHDVEVVLVDDGSRDGSAQVAKTFCERDQRFRLVTQVNQGLGPARNTGVRHAEGEYLAFVDSDDLVQRQAYERMVGSLDETGSSFAAADARRFSNSSGVRESWLHREPFADDRRATHVFEFPPLALDRMVWNKVYRRSFWDEFGYEFPPIRYEDYPVTLRAHIDASAVDCIAAPVYYWRERESGESITQHRFELPNMCDRVVSAEMVMDLLDERAPQLRDLVHRHLAQIDLMALLLAFGSVPERQEAALLELSRRLAHRLDSRALADASAYDRLQHLALEAGDLDRLRRLARFRLDGGLREGLRARRRVSAPWRFENRYPGRHDRPRVAPRELYELPPQSMFLRTRVTALDWDPTAFIVRGTAEIRHLRTSRRSALHLSLVHRTGEIPLPVERFRAIDSHGDRRLVGFETRVPRTVLAALGPDESAFHFTAEFRQGRMCQQGLLRNLRAGNPQCAPGDWLTDDVWLQPHRGDDAELELQQLVRPPHVISAEVDHGAFVLSGRLPGGAATALRLARSSMETSLHRNTHEDGTWTEFTVRIPFETIADAGGPDDPFTQRTVRVPTVDDGTTTRTLLTVGLKRAVSAIHAGRLLTLTRSPGNYVNLVDGPVRLTADTVDLRSGPGGHSLVVHGDQWEAAGRTRLVWRRFAKDSDDHVDVPCGMCGEVERRWSAGINLAELIPPPALLTRSPADPLASLVTWMLFAVPTGDGPPYPVQTEAFLLGRLPIELEAGERRVALQPRAGALHVEVH